MLKNKYINIFIIICALLIFTKVDFRFDEIFPGSFVDDAEYYYHAETIAVDFDLDYSNQMPETPNRNLNVKNKDFVVPVHPIGVGLFSFPFVFLSNQISSQFTANSLISLNYFIYSLVPIFYLFLSINFIGKSLKLLETKYNHNLLSIIVFGCGVSYFAFERFSMSHAYEFFSTSFLIFLSVSYEKNKLNNSLLAFSIPICMFLALSLRWSNYFVFIIPLLISRLINGNNKPIYKNNLFILSFLISLSIFLIHTNYLYGVYTINPSDIFLIVEDRISSDYSRFFDINMLWENLIYIFKSFLIINFSQEFGLFYFSPPLFLGSILIFYFLIRKRFDLTFTIILITVFPFFATLVLNNPGYSYGYRYLYSTIPVFILIYFQLFQRNKLVSSYMLYASIFSTISILFFESTQYTVLSTDYVTNSFGLYTKYVNPTYLSGFLKSLIIPDAYLNILFTSFFGVLIIKIISLFQDPNIFIENFRAVDDKIANLISDSLAFSWGMFLILIIFYLAIIIKTKPIKYK